jgi:type III secretion protein L
MKAAKRIVGREIELSEDTIADIVANSLKSVSQHKKVTIYVNRKSKDILERHRQRLKDVFEQLEILSIQEREDVADGGCIIETEKGIINARIEALWEILEKALRGLIKHE